MTQRDDNQIIGVCRFSYLGEGGFQTQKKDFDTAAGILYAVPRMLRRFAFFEKQSACRRWPRRRMAISRWWP